MAVKKGQFAKVTLMVGVTPITVAKLREWSVSVSSEKIDSTAAGDDWASHLRGVKSWEGSATFIDADQYWLAHIDSDVKVEFFDKADDADPVYEGTCSLDFERTTPYDDLIETSVTLTGNGALALGTPTP